MIDDTLKNKGDHSSFTNRQFRKAMEEDGHGDDDGHNNTHGGIGKVFIFFSDTLSVGEKERRSEVLVFHRDKS